MRLRSAASAIVVAVVGTTMIGVSGRTAPPGQPPDGNPNLEGVWQALNTASWDLRDHPASLGRSRGPGGSGRKGNPVSAVGGHAAERKL